MDFATRLHDLRKQNGMTMQDLADKLNISKGAVGMYEKGHRFPNIEIEEALADIFNVDLEYLRGRSDNVTLILSDDEYKFMDKYRSLDETSRAILNTLVDKMMGEK